MGDVLARRVVRWTIGALTPAVVLLALVLDRTVASGDDLPVPAGLVVTSALTLPVVVALIILRDQPRNRVAWIMLVGPLPIALILLTEEYSWIGVSSGATLPGQALAGVLSTALWPAFYVWPVAIAFVFPTGHLPAPGWRPVAVTTFGAAATVAALVLLGEEGLDPARGGAANPVRVDGVEALEPFFWIAWGLLLAGLVMAAAAVVARYRRSRGIERLQLKWLVWSVGLVPLGLLACAASYAVFGTVAFVVPAVLLAAGSAVAVSVGIAITRHGLYAIDRIVHRTVVYATLTVLLAAAFVVVVVAGGTVLGRGSAPATAVATLVVAVAFRPLRDRVQDTVDRRFARAQYDGVRRIREFEDAVRAGVAAPEEIHTVLAEALGDPDLNLLLRLPHSGDYVDEHGRRTDWPPDRRVTTIPVQRRGSEIAVVALTGSETDRRALAERVVDAATLAIEIARWRAEVRVQLAEVEASRERVVRATDEARRHLERDLHDGAQQRLVGLGVALRRLQRSPPDDEQALSVAFDEAVAEVGLAISDLRTIAAGLRPPGLDAGLAAAVDDLARNSPLPVHASVAPIDVSPAIEVAAYYAICEAVTNAIKHSAASQITVEVTRAGDALRISVADDGAGGALPGAGSGLNGITDRVGGYGGRLRIESPPGAGTRVEVELPCGS